MNDKTEETHPLSRRRLLRSGAYAVGAAAIVGIAATGASAQVAKKASQRDAGYQESPNAGKSCSSCRQFLPPSSCTTVESPINPNGYCRLYAKKA
ncbi:MAG TPA: high potential iron sulfur protein [Rhodopseudomonas sp.]|uniref:high potential iron sulfur protein n=1 Tax=Rhodopseudomonas sp. TaxID=1078 RepID=UPI002ED9DABF